MPYFGHLSGLLFFNKIFGKYKAETDYPITAKVRSKTAHKKKVDNLLSSRTREGVGGEKTFAHGGVKTKWLVTWPASTYISP